MKQIRKVLVNICFMRTQMCIYVYNVYNVIYIIYDKQWQYLCFVNVMPSMSIERHSSSVAMVTSSGKCEFIHRHLFGGGGKCPLWLTKDFCLFAWQSSDQYTLLWMHMTRSNTTDRLSILPIFIPYRAPVIQWHDLSLMRTITLFQWKHRDHEEMCSEKQRLDSWNWNTLLNVFPDFCPDLQSCRKS